MELNLQPRKRGFRGWAISVWVIGSLLTPGAAQSVSISSVGRWTGSDLDRPWSVAIAGNYAYVAADRGGLVILDIVDPANPIRMGGVPTTSQTTTVAVSGHHVYVNDRVQDQPRLRIIDVSEPAKPRSVGSLDTLEPVWSIEVLGPYAYLAVDSAGLEVVDISDPANPRRVGGLASGWEARGLAVSGGFVYLAELYDTGTGEYRGRVQVIDVSDPTNPHRLGVYDINTWPRDIAMAGGHVLLLDDQAMHVIDVSDPAAPHRVGGYAIPSPSNVVSAGNITYLEGVRWDDATGECNHQLYVVETSDPATPRLITDWISNLASCYGGDLVVAGNSIYLNNPEWGLQILRIDGLPEEVRLLAQAAGDKLGLMWPSTATGFALESTADPKATVWELVPGTPQLNGDNHELIIPIDGPARYFRLRKP